MPENSKTIILEQLSEGRKKLRLLSAQLNKDILSSMIAGKTPFNTAFRQPTS
jgi:TRAP-type C4-dicarboxylate transport system substrate-binding protein